MNRLSVSISLVVIFSLFGVMTAESFSPATVTAPTVPVTTTTQAPPVTSSTVQTPSDARCPMWWSLARSVGFSEEQMPTLDRVLYRESRCDNLQHNSSDPNGGSYGLAQINGFWCESSKFYANGYLQHMNVLTSCADLYDPEMNLRAALELIRYSDNAGLSSWHQWAWLDDDASQSAGETP